MFGTTLARRSLEALTNTQYRRWANQLITVIAGHYVIDGSVLLRPFVSTWSGAS